MNNKKMRMGVLAGLMAAPVASVVTVSANENIEADTLAQIDVTQQSANVSTMTVASTIPNTTVAVDPADWRLNELLTFNENTVILDINRYTEMLDELRREKTSPVYNDNDLYALLEGKINYLGTLKDLKERAQKLNAELGLLKATNADTIAATKAYEKQYIQLEEDFLKNRDELDTIVKASKAASVDSTTLAAAIDHMAIYKGTLEEYILTQVPNYPTLQKFKADIVEPERFIQSTSANPVKVTIGEKEVAIDFNNFIATTTVDDTNRDAFREQYEAIKLYMATKLTPDSKKIAESHVLQDGRSLATIIKQAADDIAAADKVTALIDAMKTTEFKSESTFASKVKAINAAYDKLTERGKKLVPKYATEVAKAIDATDKATGYMAADEAINAIKALKPAPTQDYRNAVSAARIVVNGVGAAYQPFIINEPKLAEYEAAIAKAQNVEQLISELTTPPVGETTTTTDIIDARAKYTALSAQEKKVLLQNVLAELVNWEKTASDSIKVSDAISKLVIGNNKTFATNAEKVEKQFNDLGSTDKQNLVSNRDRLQLLLPLAKITGKYYNLKLSNTPEYRTAVRDIHTALKDNKALLTATTIPALSEDNIALGRLYDGLWVGSLPGSGVEAKLAEIEKAEAVEQTITTAKNTTGPTQLSEITKARAAYNDLSANEKKIVNNLPILTELEKIVSAPAKVAAQIVEVDPTSSTFESKAKAAVGAFDKLTSSQKAYIDQPIQDMVKDYKNMLDFITQIKAIKITNPSYRSDVEKAQNRLAELEGTVFISTKKQPLLESLESYDELLTRFENAITNSDRIVDMITNLPSKTGQAFLTGIADIEAEYALLSANDKKLVTNYSAFQTLKKDSTAALKVVDLINHPTIQLNDVANSNYVKVMQAAITAYEKLTTPQRGYVYNYDSRIKPNLKVYDLAVTINKINPNSKTFREDVNAARAQYDRLSAREQAVAAPLLEKLEGSEMGVEEVQKVIDLINEAVPGSENYTEKLKAARTAYDQLATINSAYQKLVLNYKVLQDREKAIFPVTSSIYEIKELEILMSRPFNDATDFVKKYRAAMNAYEKIPFESRQLIENRDVLLTVIYPVASTMEAIMNIKPSSTTFGPDVLKARQMYDLLSASDKALVTNYNTLAGYEDIVSRGLVVDELIRAIPTYSGTAYTQAIKDARAAYDQLGTSEQKAVSQYKQLQAYEKGVQNVITAINLIDALQFSSNLVSAYDKAMKAIDKLTADQRQMVGNISKLTAVAPAIEVYKMIANLKPGVEGYSGSVQAAYAAFNRLTNTEKQFVTNFSQLQEAKNNVDNLNAVIAKIKEILPGSRNYNTQVQEALALYNSLPSAVKKLVTNYDVLKQAQGELAAVDKVRALIGEIDNQSASFAEKVIAARAAYDKLTSAQKRLVSNYFMLEDYERELGTMF